MNNLIKMCSVGMLVVFLCVSFSGCASMRQKFVRQKKKEVTMYDADPILDPIDYEKQRVSPAVNYQQHYSLWQVWSREFLFTVADINNEKRWKYLYDQMIGQMAAMHALLQGEKKEQMGLVFEKLKKEAEFFQKPDGLRDVNKIQSAVDRAARDMRLNFKPDDVANSFVNP